MVDAVCIGAGNVASSLVPALSPYVRFRQVYSRDLANARALADRIGDCKAVDDPAAIADADFYLVSLSDDAVAPLLARIPPRPDAVWAHTSGTLPSDTLSRMGKRYGVFYPLQTFTKGEPVDLKPVPFFIWGNDKPTREWLAALASKLSESVHFADDSRRGVLHIAGVLSCNFVTELLLLTQRELERGGMSLDVVAPLVAETLKKTFAIGPRAAMTGPARRGNLGVINRHIEKLDGDAERVYRLMSEIILKEFGHEQN